VNIWEYSVTFCVTKLLFCRQMTTIPTRRDCPLYCFLFVNAKRWQYCIPNHFHADGDNRDTEWSMAVAEKKLPTKTETTDWMQWRLACKGQRNNGYRCCKNRHMSCTWFSAPWCCVISLCVTFRLMPTRLDHGICYRVVSGWSAAHAEGHYFVLRDVVNQMLCYFA